MGIGARPVAAQWAALVGASAVLGCMFVSLAVPAAILIGPMLVGIMFGIADSPLRVPRPVFTACQGVVGCLIASSVTGAVLQEIARDWSAILCGLCLTVVASTAIGWVVARFGSLPASAAAWGSSPGAASAMVAMAQEVGADARLVAAMQYVRVIAVVLTASLVSKAIADALPHALPPHPNAPAPPTWPGILATLAVAILGSALGRRLGIPAGGMLVPLAIGAVVNWLDIVHLATPTWLLALAYAGIGWSIGLQFERATVFRSVRALPEIVAAAAAVIALCGATAVFLVIVLGIEPLTAFLATSPGGIDTVAIIALSGGADTPFVMASQTLRVLVVVATGPWIARWIARSAAGPSSLDTPGPAP